MCHCPEKQMCALCEQIKPPKAWEEYTGESEAISDGSPIKAPAAPHLAVRLS